MARVNVDEMMMMSTLYYTN